jgi:hypothetical protein
MSGAVYYPDDRGNAEPVAPGNAGSPSRSEAASSVRRACAFAFGESEMKRPSILQIFFAHQWPMRLWLGGWTLGIAAAAISATEPRFAMFSDWTGFLLFVVVVIVSPLLGFFLGIFAGSVILPPLYELRERLNGGPFKAGDSVQILVGPHSGRITTIVSPWQGRSYRVNLDEESEKTFKDIFGSDQLIKNKDAEPGAPPNGGPATQLGTSGVTEGPPSVS